MNTTPKQLNIDFNAVLELAAQMINNSSNYYITAEQLALDCENDFYESQFYVKGLTDTEIELALTIAAGQSALTERSSDQKAASLQGINRLIRDIEEVN